jgi:ABC-type uncharacterized transport system ATPase component
VIALPLLKSISVEGFGLYPGTPTDPGLNAVFQPGLTLILGANGLGKTTLVTLLYRMCTGPFDLPAGGASLGGRRVEPRKLSRAECRMFATRVVDDASPDRARVG